MFKHKIVEPNKVIELELNGDGSLSVEIDYRWAGGGGYADLEPQVVRNLYEALKKHYGD